MRRVFRIALAFGLVAALAAPARAAKCPNIMLVLDQSGSMDETPNGDYPAPQGQSKWELLQKAVETVLMAYGDQLPFGLEMFTSAGFDNASCYSDAKIDVEPDHDTASVITQKVLAAKPDSGTNTGEAIRRAAADPRMQDQSRGQYIILITDGDPNCNDGEGSNASYTVSQIKAAAAAGIQTFVVGFDGTTGVKPSNLNAMAKAGGQPKMGCNGTTSNCYYSAQNATSLNDALMTITTIITGGEFGMQICDDSCYANGCDPGYVCTTTEVNPKPHCEPDPCSNAQCADGSFCRAGMCVNACLTPCKATEKCQDGLCVPDLCLNSNCGQGQVCDATSGQCVSDPCASVTCSASLKCDPADSKCKADACAVIKCPTMTTCVAGGNCEAFYGDGGVSNTAKPPRKASGCSVSPGGGASVEWLMAALLLAGFALLTRRMLRRA